MKLRAYIHDEKTQGHIERICREAGIDVLTPADVRKRKKLPAGVQFFLDDVDVLIMEITKPTQLMQFILAQALLADKPTLCLYGKNQPPRQLLSYLKKRKSPRPLKTFSYIDTNMKKALVNFLNYHNTAAPANYDIPSFKFTVRLSPRIEEYLEWCREQHGMSKADYIRDLLTRLAKEDPQYKKSVDKSASSSKKNP